MAWSGSRLCSPSPTSDIPAYRHASPRPHCSPPRSTFLSAIRNRCRAEAFENVGTNKPIGLGYNREFGEILKREKLHNDAVDKATRSMLLNIMDHEHEVVAWHATLSKEQQRKWNHPSSIYRTWKLLTAPPKAPPKPKPVPEVDEDDPEGQNFKDVHEGLQARDNKIKARDNKIEQMREIAAELRSENAWLRGLLGDALESLGHHVSKPPTNDEIKAALGGWL